MGITGLIPFLEKSSSKIHIKEIRGYTVAIDTYCWLHKGAFGCAEKLCRGEETDVYWQYCLKYVNLLLSYDIKPILVFDGRHLPAKSLTEKRRRDSRKESKKRAAELLRIGKIDEAKSYMRRCVDITHEMALKLIKECRKMNVDCIVAPYEADAQMAYLNKLDIAQYIITEDSDLVLFGSKKIIFKLDLTGNGLLVESEKLFMSMGCKEDKFTFDKFRNMCIISGCDYLDSLPGIGLAKACKFVLKTEETDMRRGLKKIPQYLNMRQLNVSDEYIEEFLKAAATFKHMFVYDPFKRKMVRLNDVPDEDDQALEYCSNAGEILDNDVAFQLALGNLNPFTLKLLDDWNPDYYNPKEWAKKRTSHRSIWVPNFKAHTPKKKSSLNVDIRSALNCKKIKYNIEPYNTLEEVSITPPEDEVVSYYTEGEPPKKRQCSEVINVLNLSINTEDTKKHNPFAKQNLDPNCNDSITKENNSLLNVLSPQKQIKFEEEKSTKYRSERLNKVKKILNCDDKEEVKSRFFTSNYVLTTENEKIETKSNSSSGSGAATTQLQNSVTNEIIEIEKNICKFAANAELLYLSSPPENNGNTILSRGDSGIESLPDDESTKNNNLSAFKYNTKLPKLYEEESQVKEAQEVIEISDSELRFEKTKSNDIKTPVRRVGLTKPKKNGRANTMPNSQTRLSMFGFQKRPSLK